jgi:hypothetical protein
VGFEAVCLDFRVKENLYKMLESWKPIVYSTGSLHVLCFMKYNDTSKYTFLQKQGPNQTILCRPKIHFKC